MSQKLANLADTLGKLTLLEALDLTKRLQTKWGISLSFEPVPAKTEQPKQVEPSQLYKVFLESHGPNKVSCIKALRTLFAPLGLAEAKAISERNHVVIADNVDEITMNLVRKTMTESGASISVHPA